MSLSYPSDSNHVVADEHTALELGADAFPEEDQFEVA